MRVLSIDGGGVRGLLPATVLAVLEERTGRRVADMFDLIAGTSTGGILATGLTVPGPDGRPRFTARDLVPLYAVECPRIFDKSLVRTVRTLGGAVDERYDDAGLQAVTREYAGDARLSETVTDLLVPAYDIERREPFFFRSSRARASARDDHRLADVARSTAAAPTYFEPQVVEDVAGHARRALIDGGLFADNPAMCAYAELGGEDVELLVSLGTGKRTRPLRADRVEDWGALEWARPILEVVFDGVADTVDAQLGHLLRGDGYVRLQIELDEASDDLDDASPRNIAALEREAQRLLEREAVTIDRLVRVLGGDTA